MNNLADLRRALTIPGVVLKLIDMDPTTRRIWKAERLTVAEAGRKVAKVQTNAWMFEGGSWMDFGKAADWKFEGNRMTWTDPHTVGFFLTYEMVMPA
jgi:hypothetical protein